MPKISICELLGLLRSVHEGGLVVRSTALMLDRYSIDIDTMLIMINSIGQSFLKNWYTIFRTDVPSVSFAAAKNNQGLRLY